MERISSSLLSEFRRFDWFYIDNRVNNDILRLSPREARHARVLRKKKGDKIVITDGVGNLCLAEVLKCDRDEILLTPNRWQHFEDEYERTIDLYVVLLKGNKNRLIVQKATELGLNSINFFHSRRSVVKVKDPLKRLQSFKWIAVDAMKQSKYPYVPKIKLYDGIEDVIMHIPEDSGQKFLFWEGETRAFKRIGGDKSHVLAVVGGEGGFESSEVNRFVKAGFTTVSLGARILRAETAMIAAMILLRYK